MANELSSLSLRATLVAVLRREGIDTIEALCDWTPSQLWELPDVGRASIQQIREALSEAGRKLPEGRMPRAGERKPPTVRTGRCPTLAEFLDARYEPWLLQHRKSATRTLRRLRYSFRDLMNYRLTQLRPGPLEQWRTLRLMAVTPQTTNVDVAVLRSAVGRAVAWEIIDEHPMRLFRPLVARTNVAGREMSDAESAQLLAKAEALPHRDPLRAMVIVAMWTGLRWAELAELRWSDFMHAEDRPVVRVRVEVAKGKRERIVPLSSRGLAALEAWRAVAFAHRRKPNPESRVFPGRRGGRRHDTPRAAFNRLQADAGVLLPTGRPRRWHDLRHHFASVLARRGVPLPQVQELCGHSSLKITERYVHTQPEHLRTAVSRLDGIDGDYIGERE